MINKDGTNNNIGIDRPKVVHLGEHSNNVDFPPVQSDDTSLTITKSHLIINNHRENPVVFGKRLKTTLYGRRLKLTERLDELLISSSFSICLFYTLLTM